MIFSSAAIEIYRVESLSRPVLVRKFEAFASMHASAVFMRPARLDSLD